MLSASMSPLARPAERAETLGATLIFLGWLIIPLSFSIADWLSWFGLAFLIGGISMVVTARRMLRSNGDGPEAPPLFLYIPVSRLILWSIASSGLYGIYWMYENWRYIKERDKLQISPFWRALFGVFYCYSLLLHICSNEKARSVEVPSFSPWVLANAWIVLFCGSLIVLRLSGFSSGHPSFLALVAGLIPSFLCFVPVQNYVNRVTQRKFPNQIYHRWTAGHWVCLLVGSITWIKVMMNLSEGYWSWSH